MRLPLRWVLALGTLAAFGVGLWLSANKPSVAYYLLPARAWELALGAVLAAGVIPPLRVRGGDVLCEVVPALGIAMILFAVLWIRSDMLFPGWVALIPVLGAALVIHAGGESRVARHILAARPMVFVGLLSYSLYLWHWPVLVALRIRSASAHLDPALAAAGIALTFALAALSWRFVERPFRDRRAMSGRRLLTWLGAGAVAVLAIAGLSILMAGFPGRLSEPARIALAAASDIDPLRPVCEGVHDRAECRFGNPAAPITYAIIGDSHAAAIRPAVAASGLMGDEAGTLYWAAGCPLLVGIQVKPDGKKCTAFKTAAWDKVAANPDLRTVILAGRWPYQMTGWLPESGGSNSTWLVDDQTTTPSVAENAAVLARALTRTIDRLTTMGLRVVIIGAVPEAGFDVPHTVAMARHAGLVAPRGIRRELVAARAGAADDLLARIVGDRAGVRLLSIWERFCDAEWCDIERAGVPIYYDDDHLSYTGAREVVAPMLAIDN